jgi:hypothetical protein
MAHRASRLNGKEPILHLIPAISGKARRLFLLLFPETAGVLLGMVDKTAAKKYLSTERRVI